MNKQVLWKILQFVINWVLSVTALTISTSLWIVIPILLMGMWSFLSGYTNQTFRATLFSVLVNGLFIALAILIGHNPLLVIPLVLIIMWNYIDGTVRKNWKYSLPV